MRWAMLALVVGGCGERQQCPDVPADAGLVRVPFDGVVDGGVPHGWCEVLCPQPPPNAALLTCAAHTLDGGQGEAACWYLSKFCW